MLLLEDFLLGPVCALPVSWRNFSTPCDMAWPTFRAHRLRKEPLYARSPPVVVITYVSGYLAAAITLLDIILVIRVTGELLNLLDPFIDLIPHFDW